VEHIMADWIFVGVLGVAVGAIIWKTVNYRGN
jgi:hypothetical protein